MATPDLFEFERLNAFNAPAFAGFTYKAYQRVLYGLGDWSPQVAVGAFADGVAAGLALGEVTPRKSAVLSLFTGAGYRNRGLGATLLRKLEQEMIAKGASSATITYVTGKPSTAALERVMAKCEWPEPYPKHLVCTSDKRMYPWMAEYKLPPEFEVFRWAEITDEDRASLRRSQEVEGWVPPDLWPFDYEETMEPANSVGVRYKGQVVGWVITQPREPDAVCYSCSYMRPDLQRRGRLVAAYAEAVRRQVEFAPTKPFGIWIVPYKHRPMAAFVLRRMRPHLITLEEFRESRKEFAQPAAEDAVTQAVGGVA